MKKLHRVLYCISMFAMFPLAFQLDSCSEKPQKRGEYQFYCNQNSITIYDGDRFVDSLQFGKDTILDNIVIQDNQ